MELLNSFRLNAALVCCLVAAVSTASASDVDISIPDNARVARVSNGLNQNGMQLSIQTFQSPDSTDAVLEFYRKQWFREGDIPGFVENEMGEWQLISQLRDEHNIVLQVKPGMEGGSEGFLSVAEKTGGRRAPEVDFPMPDGTERFSSTYVEENDSQVHTMTFVSNQDIGSAASFYRDTLPRRGWELAREDSYNGSQIMMFNRKGDRCELVVSQPDGDITVIYVNRVQRNG